MCFSVSTHSGCLDLVVMTPACLLFLVVVTVETCWRTKRKLVILPWPICIYVLASFSSQHHYYNLRIQKFNHVVTCVVSGWTIFPADTYVPRSYDVCMETDDTKKDIYMTSSYKSMHFTKINLFSFFLFSLWNWSVKSF